MPKTLAGLIYDPKTATLLRIVIPDDDDQLHHHVGPGEAMTTMSLLGVDPVGRSGLERARQAVIVATGRRPPS